MPTYKENGNVYVTCPSCRGQVALTNSSYFVGEELTCNLCSKKIVILNYDSNAGTATAGQPQSDILEEAAKDSADNALDSGDSNDKGSGTSIF